LEREKIKPRPAKKFIRNANTFSVSRENEDDLSRNESCFGLANRKQRTKRLRRY
jgi:hypothetical protein